MNNVYYFEERKPLIERMQEKDKEIFDQIVKLTKDKSTSPTVLEIKKAAKMNSTSTTLHYLRRLKEQGYIDWEPKKPRTLRITKDMDEKSSVG